MQWLYLSLALVLFQTAAPTQKPQERGSVTGSIVKLGTGEPVSKAVVTISTAGGGGRAQSYSATTGSGGQFTFQNLEPGQYRLSAARSGYVRMEYGARVPNRPGLPITIDAGRRLTDVVLQLIPAGTISGRVFDRDGEPLANVVVEALKYSYQEGQRVMNVVQTARTNDLGEYRLFWLQPGAYFVSATPPEGQRGALLNALAVAGPGIAGAIVDIIANRGGGQSAGAGARGGQGRGGRGATAGGTPAPPEAPNPAEPPAEGYVPVYYPGTTDAQSAAPINLTPGTIFSGVDLTAAAVRTLRVQGQVIDGVTGQPAQNANVMLLPVQRQGGGFRAGIRNPGSLRARVNNQGGFEIRGIVPGSYELVGVLNDRNNRMTGRMPVEIGGSDIQNVSLVMSPGFTLTGRLAIEGQTGAGNQDLARTRVMLRPDSAAQIGGAPPASPVQPDGAFTLQQVGRDDYRLNVAGMPRNGYVKAARYGSVDVMNEGLRLDRQPTASLEILVSTNTGTAEGVVQNEKQEAVANVMVVFVPDSTRRNRLDLYRTTSTDSTGRYHIEGIPPGDYKVFSWEEVEAGAWQDPDFVRQFEDRGKAVRINENTTSVTELRLIPPAV